MIFTTNATFAQEEEVIEAVEVQEVQMEEVAVADLPEAITAALAANFADYTANKAYKTAKDDKEVYWVELSGEKGAVKVLFSAEGEVLEQQDVKS
ncbi:MAG: hypothetical protein CR989_00360 [Flavobacteriales bacterium]|nr:MAG: hypothetical protein CR989_00360 [Flavobacteriales bacterium]